MYKKIKDLFKNYVFIKRKVRLDRKTLRNIEEIVSRVDKAYPIELKFIRNELSSKSSSRDTSMTHLILYNRLYKRLKHKFTTSEALAFIRVIEDYSARWDLMKECNFS